MGRFGKIAAVAGLVVALTGLPVERASAESPIHPENRPAGI